MSSKLLMADSSDLTLIGLQAVVKPHHGWEILEPARSAAELLDKAQAHHPQIILFQQHLDPLVDVLALVERLKQITPYAKLIVLGNQVDGLLVRDLFACGVLGYLFSGDDLSVHLVSALEKVAARKHYLSPSANSAYLTAMSSPGRDWKLNSEARVVLRLLARGLHISEIADQMGVPMRRIYWVRQKLRRRFGANTNEHLVSIAIGEGFAYAD